jgi:putative Holliday junction resolvase
LRILALDYGSARCGCAISDPTGTLATPLGVIESPGGEDVVAAVQRLVEEHAAERVVVGLPVSLSGEDSAQTAQARGFAERLAAALPVPVDTYDERFTTSLAKRTPGRTAEDARAAAHLLESYLTRYAR